MAGASGYAGGEILRLLLAHPQFEIGAVTAASSAGARLGGVHPHLSRWPTASSRHDGRDPGGPRRRLPRPAARPLGGPRAQLPDEVVVIDCGADFRLDRAGLDRLLRHPRTPGRGPTGCPSCPARPAPAARAARRADRASPCPAATRPPSRSPSPPASPPACSSPTTSSSSPPRAPRAPAVAQAAPARQRGDGLDVALRRGRRPPAHPRDRAEPVAGRRGAGHRLLHADAGPDAARHPRHLHRAAAAGADPGRRPRGAWQTAYADEPFVHLLPDGQWPRDRRRARAATPSRCRSPSTSAPGASSSSRPSTTSPRAPPAPPCSAPTSPSVSTRPSACPIAGLAP